MAKINTTLLFIFTLLFYSNPALAHGNELHFQFLENKGQWPEQVEFRAEINSGWLYLEKNCLTYDFWDLSVRKMLHIPKDIPKDFDINKARIKQHAFKVWFEKANPNTTMHASGISKEYYNFFKGKNPEKWASNVHAFENIKYNELYPGIDLQLYTQSNSLKYDLIVQPKSNVKDIKLRYDGVDKLRLVDGNLRIQTIVGEIIEQQPIAFQIIDGKRTEVLCNFKLHKNTISFELPNGYDKTKELVIDPLLIFASYSGSTADNFGMTATYDNAGNLYSGGMVFGNGYPTTIGAFETSFNGTPISGNSDIVISKFDSTGASLIYSTYLGGTGTEAIHSIIVDNSNNLYLYGTTSSSDFPTQTGAYDNSFNGGTGVNLVYNGTNFLTGTDIYIAKLNADATSLLGCTYIGGSQNDGLNYNITNPQNYDSLQSNYGDQFRGEIILDADNNVVVASSTRSSNFPIVNGFDNSFGGDQDGVVMKFTSNLDSLIWSTYLGGSNKDGSYSVKLDTAGNAYVVGGTISTDFPFTTGALDSVYNGGSADGYISKIGKNGDTLMVSTLMGTTAYDQVYFVELDRFENVYVVGQSEGNYPVINVNYSNPNSGQFVSKLTNELDSIIYSTVFGNGDGTANVSPSAFLVDRCQNVYVSGWGGNIITGPALNGMPTTPFALYPNSPNGYDFYLIVFRRDIDSLIYASYFGGSISSEHVDGGTSRFDKLGRVYQSVCAGCGGNSDFPTSSGAWSNTNLSTNCNNGVFKYDFEIVPVADFEVQSFEGCSPFSLTFLNKSDSLSKFWWDFGNGDIDSVTFNPTRQFIDTGTHVITLAIHDSICDLYDTIQKTVTVKPAVFAASVSDTVVCSTDTVQLIANSFGTADTFIWSTNNFFGDTLNLSLVDSTILVTSNGLTQYFIQTIKGNCISIDSVNVTYDSVLANIAVIANSNCDTCTGIAAINGSGGIPPYTYIWDDSLAQTTSSATGLCYGVYNGTVFDSLGCSKSLSIGIVDTSNIALTTSSVTHVLCNGDCNGTATVSPTGGTPPYTILWSDSIHTDTNGTNLCPGTYLVTIEDTSNCIAIDTIVIEEPASTILAATADTLACSGDCNGIASTNVSGGVTPYSFLWNNGQTNSSATGLCAGAYSVTFTDGNGCTKDTVIIVTQPTQIAVTKASTPEICYNNCDGTAHATALGGTPNYTYLWTGPNVSSSNDSISGLCPGTYLILITDSNNCTYLDSVAIESSSSSKPIFDLSGSPDTIYQGQITTLNSNYIAGNVYTWSPAETLGDPGSSSTSAMPAETTTYTLSIAENSAGGICTYDSTLTIVVLELTCDEPYIYVPNTFTPNGDGQNDVFRVRSNVITELSLNVFNRWGELIFQTNDVNGNWNGNYLGSEADPDVFVYHLNAICLDGQQFIKKGNVTLVR